MYPRARCCVILSAIHGNSPARLTSGVTALQPLSCAALTRCAGPTGLLHLPGSKRSELAEEA